MNEDFRARLIQRAQEIKAQREAAEAEIVTLQDLKQKTEENYNATFKKLQSIRDAVQSIGTIPTLSDLRNLLSVLKELVKEVE